MIYKNTAAEYYAFASKQLLTFDDSFEKHWVKESIINAAEVFGDAEALKMEGLSEDVLLHKVLAFVYRAFRNGEVKAKLGERTSASSGLGRNEGRSVELTERRERKVVGAKVDILFKKINYEFGCAEVGKHDVLSIDGKYLSDGMIKLPQTLRDMLCSHVEVNPNKLNDLYTVGFLMMGLNLELLLMNVPAGKTITRITRTKKLPLPITAKSIRTDLLPLLEVTLMAKISMEKLANIFEDRRRKAVVLCTDDASVTPRLPFSFV